MYLIIDSNILLCSSSYHEMKSATGLHHDNKKYLIENEWCGYIVPTPDIVYIFCTFLGIFTM